MIDCFIKEFRFLSNFHLVEIWYEGKCYSSTEHAYQAAKTLVPEEREKIRLCGAPKEARKLGQKVTMRPDWEQIKIQVMLNLLREKFEHPDLKERLLATGDAELVEGNWWGDTFWGVCNGVGQNNLGKLLMQVRLELSHVE